MKVVGHEIDGTKLLYTRMAAAGDFCDSTKPDWGYPTKLEWEQVVKVNP
ncbi:hypothetical protein [uncultured Bacteroides sp.]|nr:hypothetical protein [uncultured Bacteroides sp.]